MMAIRLSRELLIPEEIAIIFQIIALTIIILLIGEVTPKLWANRYPIQFVKIIAVPLYWVGIIFYPISKVLTDTLGFLSSKIEFNLSKTALHSGEIRDLAELSAENGTIKDGEHELIHGIVSLKTVMAREVMTPRVDITSVPVDASFDELINIINESGHSRIPLYENNLDNILGIIYVKDLLPYLHNDEMRKKLSLKKIVREALFVPETKLINDLLHLFQEKKMHIGIVVDEYGGTSGLISLEDILEEIVGDIRDEYDQEETEITKLNENSFLLLGKTSIDELNELFNDDFTSENDDYDTVGGFIFNHLGSIPQQDFVFEYKNYRFTIKEIDNKRINKVLIERIAE
jgi:CBS domain containing-hemolysin-like protein